ncbi:MAG: bifunctional (p)ppGpp synthetase/guanosine-3',5'-bis(diphosphate) 3'-pyrophosphohydrolase [Chloroflexi bacterium]|nr:bifunctional (p)ppGpp synthetase/guanosine-3',5'-bis(diphosphate) 3'-pyrophosphohydrolase [Chloroflexota bacterium]
MVGLNDLLTKVKSYLPDEKLTLIEEAYDFASKVHDSQLRLSGEPFIVHPLGTAIFLADLQLDATSIAAGLLHDTTEDGGVSLEDVEAKFGPEVRKLVNGVTKLTKLEVQALIPRRSAKPVEDEEVQAESVRKMLLAMAEDVRVVLIKLADRLHNMNTLQALPPARRVAIAKETLDIYAPLAHRLGISEIKWQLEDLAFGFLEPAEYKRIIRLVAAGREERERYIAKVSRILKEHLERAGIKAEVTGRPKNIYSIYHKINKYASQGKEFGQIYDLYALRVLVDEVQDCYSALGIVHSLWHPLPGQFDDYIANPRENMYRSLHTTVMCLDATPLEIQIRTHEMHRFAEYGVAAHWRYKEGGKSDVHFEERISWLRQLLEWQREVTGAEEFLESVKTDILRDQVFVFTPKGEVKELPAGATPIDFAYLIHTELGHKCAGAKVNGRLVSLDYKLSNGDTVEIVASKLPRGPSLDWLNPDLGYIQTASAREKIRLWFRKRERAENVQRGKELLEKERRRLGITRSDEELAHLLKFDSVEEFLAALGSGTISTHQIAKKLEVQEEPTVLPQVLPTRKGKATDVEVLGVGNLLTRLALCCNPLPGDEVVGFVTRSRGLTVHRADCRNVINEDEKERLVPVNWGASRNSYPVPIRIVAWDRVGLLRDISTVVSEEGVNIASIKSVHQEDGTVLEYLLLQTTGIDQLSRLLSRLDGVKGVISVARSTQSSA